MIFYGGCELISGQKGGNNGGGSWKITLSAVVAAVKQGWVPSYLPRVIRPGTSLCSSSKVKTGLIVLFMVVWSKGVFVFEVEVHSYENNRYVYKHWDWGMYYGFRDFRF